jgi:hypothetical protein
VEGAREAHLVERELEGQGREQGDEHYRLGRGADRDPARLVPREDGPQRARVEERGPRLVHGVDQEMTQVAEGEGERPVRIEEGEGREG